MRALSDPHLVASHPLLELGKSYTVGHDPSPTRGWSPLKPDYDSSQDEVYCPDGQSWRNGGLMRKRSTRRSLHFMNPTETSVKPVERHRALRKPFVGRNCDYRCGVERQMSSHTSSLSVHDVVHGTEGAQSDSSCRRKW